MKKYFLILLLPLALLGCRKDAITRSESCTFDKTAYAAHPKAVKLQSLLDDYAAKGLPGIIVLVRDTSGTWIGSSGMADIGKGIKMEPCHISKAASVTKMFISALTFLVAEEGYLQIDEPASKYLDKEVVEKVQNLDKVSIRQLLNHTTGIYDVITDTEFYLEVLNNPNKSWKPKDLLPYVYGKDAYFAAGDSASYSNTNYLLLAMIIDKATGADHAQLMQQKILQPLGLSHTYYHWHMPLPENNVAQGYFDLYNNGKIINMSNYNTGSGNGYGGLYSTVTDMQVFIEALLREKTLLSQSSLNEMLKLAPTIENRKYLGTGLFRDFIDFGSGNHAYGHRGRDLGYTGDLFYFPERDITLSLLINYGTDAKSELRDVFLEFRDKLGVLILE